MQQTENTDHTLRVKEVELLDESKPPYLTYFLIDGLDRHVFKKLLNNGELPNIAEMIKRGGWVKNGVTSFPSMTGYAFYSFLTGEDSAKSGVMGLRWFNRDVSKGKPGIRNYVGKTNHFMNKDFSLHTPTIFEKFSNNHSFSIQSYANRGVKLELKLSWPLVTAKFKNSKLMKFLSKIPKVKSTLHDWFSYEDLVIDKSIEDLFKKPKVQWITFASTDSCSHLEGTSEQYINTVRHVDKMIGKYIAATKRMGLHENRIYCIISDHGQTDIKYNLDIGRNLGEKLGLRYKSSSESAVFSDQLDNTHSKYKDLDLIACVNGNSGVYLYFRNPSAFGEQAWTIPLTPNILQRYPTPLGNINLIHEVVNIEGVALAFTRGSDNKTCEIHSADGSSRVIFNNEAFTYRYEVIRGNDPLKYDCSMHNVEHSAERWLHLTYDTEFPHGIVRGFNMMQAEASGDIMVIAKPEYDFGKDCEPIVKNYKGGHGGLCKDHMIVPFIISGPGVRSGSTAETATAEDVGATLFELMGVKTAGSGRIISSLLEMKGLESK